MTAAGNEIVTMKEWVEVAIGDLLDIEHGYAFKGQFIHNDPQDQSDILLTPGNFAIGGGFRDDKFKYYAGIAPEGFVLHPDDLLVTMTDLSKESDTLGCPALVPSKTDNRRYLHNQRLGKIKLKAINDVEFRYIYYVMCSRDYRNEILASCTGTTVKHTSPERIKQYRFLLPPKEEQRAIAHVLGTLDDKVELNRRMNRTLEEMARAIFQDWFVDFGPTRAKMEGQEPYLPPELWDLFPDELVDSELGEIPAGWEVSELRRVSTFPVRTVKPHDFSSETPYIGLEHMPRRSLALNEWETAERITSNKLSFQKDEFLFGKLRPYFHKVGMAPIAGICSTDIVVVSPKTAVWSSFVLLCISTEEFVSYTDQTSNGTKMPRTSWKIMGQYKICLPPEPVAQAFQRTSQDLLTRISSNIHESHVLRKQRDTLLPHLFSGEVTTTERETPYAL